LKNKVRRMSKNKYRKNSELARANFLSLTLIIHYDRTDKQIKL